MKTYTFHLSGTHCASCKIFIEDALKENEYIDDARVDLKNKLLTVTSSLEKKPEEYASILTEIIHPNGYTVSVQKKEEGVESNGVIWKAVPIGLAFLVVFFLLQKSGILNIGFGGVVTPSTSFLIGLIASVSSCLAVVGGLVLSLSAKVSQDSMQNTKIFSLFHIGRLGSFYILGGVLGAIGGVLGGVETVSQVLGLLASLVMIYVGLHIVGVFEKNKITLPATFFNFLKRLENTPFTPLVLGFATFFLPCGFTQSMQISALSSGSFFSGGSIMLSFALGTLPVLALLSFGTASFAKSKHAPLFLKSAGVVVIGLGVFAFLSQLAGLGIINPLFTL